MVTDEERREAARRLREASSYYESMGRDVDFYPVESALGLKPAGETAYTPESVRSLADLIDPDTTSEQTNHDESSLSASLINRDALLELADILGSTGEMDCIGCRLEGAGCAKCSSGVAHEAARRIREALGVQDA